VTATDSYDELVAAVGPDLVEAVYEWAEKWRNHNVCHETARQLRREIGEAVRKEQARSQEARRVKYRAEVLLRDDKWRQITRGRLTRELGLHHNDDQ
jgi:hypothetical protein